MTTRALWCQKNLTLLWKPWIVQFSPESNAPSPTLYLSTSAPVKVLSWDARDVVDELESDLFNYNLIYLNRIRSIQIQFELQVDAKRADRLLQLILDRIHKSKYKYAPTVSGHNYWKKQLSKRVGSLLSKFKLNQI